MTDFKFMGQSSTDILFALTIGATVLGVLALITPVILPLIFSRLAVPSHANASLDDTKTALEVQDLRFGWMRTLGTAILTAAIAVGGWAFQEQAARDDRIQRERSSERDTLSHFLEDMGDSNTTKRIAAITFLASQLTLEHQDESLRGLGDPGAKSSDTVILASLAYRDAVESDSAVADILVNAITDAATNTSMQKSVIEAVAAENRRLYRAAQLVEKKIEPELSAATFNAAFRYSVRDTRAAQAYRKAAAANRTGMIVYQKIADQLSPEVLLGFASRNALPVYQLTDTQGQDSPALRFVDWRHIQQVEKQNISQLRQVQDEIFRTSNTLVEMLNDDRIKKTLPDTIDLNLSEVLVMSSRDMPSLDGVKLRGANFQNADLNIELRNSQIEFSDFSGADLSNVAVQSGSAFTGDDFDGTDLPGFEKTFENGDMAPYRLGDPSDLPQALSGTNWPLSSTVDKRPWDLAHRGGGYHNELKKQHAVCVDLAMKAAHSLKCPWEFP